MLPPPEVSGVWAGHSRGCGEEAVRHLDEEDREDGEDSEQPEPQLTVQQLVEGSTCQQAEQRDELKGHDKPLEPVADDTHKKSVAWRNKWRHLEHCGEGGGNTR